MLKNEMGSNLMIVQIIPLQYGLKYEESWTIIDQFLWDMVLM